MRNPYLITRGKKPATSNEGQALGRPRLDLARPRRRSNSIDFEIEDDFSKTDLLNL